MSVLYAMLYLLFFLITIVFAIVAIIKMLKKTSSKLYWYLALASFIVFFVFFVLTGVTYVKENPTADIAATDYKTDIEDSIEPNAEKTNDALEEISIIPESTQEDDSLESSKSVNSSNEVSSTISTTEVENTLIIKEETPSEPSTAQTNDYDNIENVPYYTLITNLENYIGKTVKTTVKIETSFDLTDNEGDYIKGKTQLHMNSTTISPLNYVGGDIYLDDIVKVEDGAYVTVVFNVSKDEYGSVQFTNGHVVDMSNSAKIAYEEDYNTFVSEFWEEAESVSYDTLMRYPDSYKGKKVKIKVKIKTAEPDGLIFQGDLIGTVVGTSKDISFYDAREIREPRLMVGDVVTICGFGDGLMTMKTVDRSGIIPKTINEYDIPSISLWFVEF